MSRFDEFVDEFVFMAKSAAGVASKKTGEVVEISKLKYQIKQAEWDIEKAYAKLGAIVYESKRSTEDFADAILLATGEIDDLNLKIDALEEKLRSFKKAQKCGKCGKENDTNATYCAYCGTVLNAAAESSASAPFYTAPKDEPEEAPVFYTAPQEVINEDEIDF